jgi:uncharacterized membrane protein
MLTAESFFGMDNREKTWHGLRAASLSLLPGLGHLYLGEKRGYVIVGFGLSLLLIARFLWEPAELLYLSMVIFSGGDAYSIAKRGHGLM